MRELLSGLLAFGRLVAASPVDVVHRPPLHSHGPSFGGHPSHVCGAGLVEVAPRDGVPHTLRRAPCPFIRSFIPLNAQVAGSLLQRQGVLPAGQAATYLYDRSRGPLSGASVVGPGARDRRRRIRQNGVCSPGPFRSGCQGSPILGRGQRVPHQRPPCSCLGGTAGQPSLPLSSEGCRVTSACPRANPWRWRLLLLALHCRRSYPPSSNLDLPVQIALFLSPHSLAA